MHELNNDKLDALFQEGSERYDFTYREDAWEAMDGMLDEQEKSRKKRYIGWWFLVGFATLVGAFGLIKYNTLDNLSSSENKVQSDQVSDTPATNPLEANSLESKVIEAEKDQNLIPENETSDLEAPTASVTKTEELNSNTIEISSNNLISTQINSDKTTSEKVDLINKKVEPVKKEVSIPEVVPSSYVTNNKTNKKQKVDSPTVLSSKGNIEFLPIRTSNLLSINEGSIAQIEIPEIVLNEGLVNSGKESSKLTNRFSFGLSIGPEYSFVLGGNTVQNDGGQTKAGYYVGLELGYLLSNKLELVTGVGLSRKSYTSNGDKYQAKPGFWIDEIRPMQFNGTCTVIEIPLSFNYYFNGAKENGWFANLGATTYVMGSEWYDFIYDPSLNRPDLKASWNDKLANDHIFGVGQISFGYQRKVNNNFRLQFSPYAKIPLTGIGNGSVNLFSTGLRVTARF